MDFSLLYVCIKDQRQGFPNSVKGLGTTPVEKMKNFAGGFFVRWWESEGKF